MEPTNKEEMDIVLANNKMIGNFMEVEPEIEYCVGNDEGYTYSPKNVGNYFSWSHQQEAECNRWLTGNPRYVSLGYKTMKLEKWPWYNQDWNKLMEVWKVIRERFRGLIPQIMLMDQTSEFHSAVDNGDIMKAYKAVVDAVNKYNTQLNNK